MPLRRTAAGSFLSKSWESPPPRHRKPTWNSSALNTSRRCRFHCWEGASWDQGEIARGAALVLVNQAFVRHYLSGWGRAGPLSSHAPTHNYPSPSCWPQLEATDGCRSSESSPIHWMTDSISLSRRQSTHPYTLPDDCGTQVLVRTQGEPLAMLHSIREQVASIDPDQQIYHDVRDLEGWIQREPEFARGRLISMLFGAFAVLALTLAAVGLYSVVSYTVAAAHQRTRNSCCPRCAAARRAAPGGAFRRNQCGDWESSPVWH